MQQLKLIIILGITSAVEIEYEAELPAECIEILEELDEIHFGQEIPENISKRLNSTIRQHKEKINQLKEAYTNMEENSKRHQCVDTQFFEEQQKIIDEMTGERVRRSRKKWFNNMQALYQQVQQEQESDKDSSGTDSMEIDENENNNNLQNDIDITTTKNKHDKDEISD